LSSLPKILFMKNRFNSLPVVIAAALLSSGCATPVAKPAFYPNAHYQYVGPAQAQADAKACTSMAQQSDVGAVNKSDATRAAATGAAGVGAAGVVSSLISGHKPDLRDIAAGAAAIGAAGAAATAAGQSVGGSNMHRQFVQQCLSERGYQVIGWH
jgi:hypothetical protein